MCVNKYAERASLISMTVRSKSALERILKRLKGAITKLLRVAKIQEPMLDYGSLMSLSSSSRADTIKTMNRLSNRLSSSTGLPMEEGRPRSLAASHGRRDSSRGSPKYESHQRGARQASAKDTLARPSGYKTRKPSGRSERVSERGGGSSRHKSRHSEGHSSRSSIGIRSQQRLQSSIPNRMSYISTSSDSTKLGEISHRRSRLVRHSDESFWEEYHCKSTYPLQPYQVPVKEKKGLLRRIFGGEGRY